MKMGSAGPAFLFIFFLCLYLLGIDSALSMLDACRTGIMDFPLGRKLFGSKIFCNTVLTIFAFFCSLVVCLGKGVNFLDVADYYINNWGMLFVGFLETFALSWAYKRGERVEKCGRLAVLWFDTVF